MKTATSVLLLLGLSSLPSSLACGPLSFPSGNRFCRGRSCTHIYNFRPCRHYNPTECTCTATTATCPGGYTMDTAGTKCYIKRTAAAGWQDASNACLRFGDERLAVISSDSQNTAVAGLGEAYIGLSDRATEGTFLWTDGTNPGGYSKWMAGQPNPATATNQDCVKMRPDGTWQAVGCNKNPFDYVCERKPTC